MENFFDTLWHKIVDFCSTSGVTILKALFLAIIGLIAIKLIVKIIKNVFKRGHLEPSVANYLITVLKIVLFVLLFLMILNILHIDTSGILAIIATASLAISLALQDTFSSLANGIIIISTKPFKQGDWIKVNGYEGTVKFIKLLYVVLTTSDNIDINIPNSKIIGTELVNYNAHKTRKVIMTFDVAYHSNVDKVKQILSNIIYQNDLAILEPEPVIRLKALNESSITFQIIVVCKTEDYWALYYDLMDSVFNEFKRENISIPFNQLEVRLLNEENLLPYRNMEFRRTNDGKSTVTEADQDILDVVLDKVTPNKIFKNIKRHKKNKQKDIEI